MNIFGTDFNYKQRVEKIRRLMDERDMDCLFVNQWANQYYISGCYQHQPWYPVCHSRSTEPPLILFRDRGEDPIFLCAFTPYHGVKEQTWIKDVRAFDRESSLGLHEYIAEILKEKGLETATIGLEENCCTISTFSRLRRALPKADFKNASQIFLLARVVKEPEEIALIKESVSIAEAALKVAMETAKPGVTEMEVQRAAEMEMRRRGGLREVATMCQSGIRTKNYRAFGSEWKKIARNELVMVDLGCVYKGYGSDISRTWTIGKSTKEQKKIASDLYNVHEKVLSFIKPGLKYKEAYDFAHAELASAGYPTHKRSTPMQHFSLHGLGLGPFSDPPDKGDGDMTLEPGMVLSVQPSVRHKTYTIRFEDDVLLTPTGLELMTTLPKELI